MDLQALVEGIDGMATLYSFDIMPDGSYSEIRLMAVNKKNDYMLHFTPDAPEFYPGIPYRSYFTELNFESFVYKSAGTTQPLYSYVYAHGGWVKGFYLPIVGPQTHPEESCIRTVYCLYTFTYTEEVETESMTKHSSLVNDAVVDISVKLHENSDFTKAMSSAVAVIKEFCGADKCAVYTVDKETEMCRLFDENGSHEGYINIFTGEMGRTPYEAALAWEKDLQLSNCLILEDPEALEVVKKRDPDWYHSLTINGIKNIILFGIRCNQDLVGFIWTADFDTSKVMLIKETLELTSFLIAAVISNHQLVTRLEIKSTTDELTRVRNRNAMNDRVDDLLSHRVQQPNVMGVAFADLNGLKKINDSLGHKAGDAILKKAAELLKQAFGKYEIYRAGGDEFVILCPDITEEDFMGKVANLRSLADSTPDVRFAIGAVYCEEDYDITSAMHTADERMYADKQAYYRTHPEIDRRKR
ncbi:GGDEF domain-containing protein [Ruminococcus sp.]|uniref:GGDEF domain-containing protein n=1 Tax=Ruminococcus sp. TaxID=41978 RepID=UPI0025CFE5BA|nr:GGDEF domain-containing protein [Ruminococcus sp.]MBQ8967803.1 sensor domain-containing diguanylate cyclase [Ruminococcus sp.]